jgi:hypothetical protein
MCVLDNYVGNTVYNLTRFPYDIVDNVLWNNCYKMTMAEDNTIDISLNITSSHLKPEDLRRVSVHVLNISALIFV